MPDDVRESLLKARLWDAYQSRPSYQQNDYVGWIERAVRAETRSKRVAQMLDELARGDVYMKMSWKVRTRSPTWGTKKDRDVYTIRSVLVWEYPGNAAWHFISLPKKTAAEILRLHKTRTRGWGSLPVRVIRGTTAWDTSIFPDKKNSTFLLPLKKDVRLRESIRAGDRISLRITIR